MRRASSILVLFVLLAFGLSLAVPAEDVPETAYDESESLPCESTPVVSIAAPEPVAEAPTVCARASLLHRGSLGGVGTHPIDHGIGSPGLNSGSLTIHNHSFRC